MEVIIVIILIFIIMLLITYNKQLKVKSENINRTKKELEQFLILRKIVKVSGENLSKNQKIDKINELVIKEFNIPSSTIVYFNGSNFDIISSNLNHLQRKNIVEIYTHPIFEKAITTGETIFLNVKNKKEKLPYLKIELDRVKTAIFMPLLSDGIFLGFWILENPNMDGFNNLAIELLEKVRDSVLDIIKTLTYQSAMENLVTEDEFTKLSTYQYLFAEGKIRLDNFRKSAVTMININNIEEVNNNIGREAGNILMSEVSKILQEMISKEYIIVRYIGPKFVIIFLDHKLEDIKIFSNQIKNRLDNLTLEYNGNQYGSKINMVSMLYYKGIDLDIVLNKLNNYLDLNKNESTISII